MRFMMLEWFASTSNMLYNIFRIFNCYISIVIRTFDYFNFSLRIHYKCVYKMTSAKKNIKKWSDEDIDNLIDLYEVNPCLWDIFDKSYQKRDVKEKALAAIAEELDVEINEIKGKWNAIRGQFGRELHKVKTSKSGQSADDLYVSQWVFWDKLQFLNKVIKQAPKAEIHFHLGLLILN